MIVSESKEGREHILFDNEEDKIIKLKELGLLSEKAKAIKQLICKGIYVSEPTECNIIGYVDENEVILDIKGEKHCIHPDYFKSMQSKNFKLGDSEEE
jgi:hypothetical protein